MLRSSNIPLFDVVNLAGDAIFIADADTGMILYGNKRACEMTGWSPDEITTLHQTDLHPQEDQDVYKDYFQHCRETRGAVSKGDRYVVTRDGRKIAVEICATTLEWNGRKIIEGVFRDLSERKTLEATVRDIFAKLKDHMNEHDAAVLEQKKLLEEKLANQAQIQREYDEIIERHRNIFYLIYTPMLIFDADETILLVNHEFERLIGYDREELEGKKNWTEFIAKYDIEQLKSYHYDVIKKRIQGNVNREFHIRDRNGNVKSVSLAIVMLPDSDRGLVSFIDITTFRTNDEVNGQKLVEMETRCHYLERVNEVLQVLLKTSENEKIEAEGNILANMKEMIMPSVDDLKRKYVTNIQTLTELKILETNLKNIISPFSRRLTLTVYNLSPREIEVASLIKEGKTTKEIKELLNLSKSSIDLHRHHIRKKLGLNKEKTNLRSFLLSIQ